MLAYEDIKKIRVEYSISQTKLSEFSGFSKAQISAWELGKKTPEDSEIDILNGVLKDVVLRISQGKLDIKKKKVQHSGTEKKLPATIKSAKEYRLLSENMNYSNDYAMELSRLYKDAMMPKNDNAIKGIALFSGCGGMTLGFEAAGIDLVGHVEIAKSANRIYAENFPKSKLLGEDICAISDEDLQAWKKEFGNIDIIVGGPPCQGFSLAGKRNPEDERNKLYKQYVRIVSAIRPKVFVMENVALMTSMRDENGELFIDKIEKSFCKQGYSLVKRIVNAYEYGVPQSRERVILIGVRKDINKSFEFESPLYSIKESSHQMELWGQKKNALTFRDATADLQSLENGEKSCTDPLHWAITHPEHVIEWLKVVPEGHSAHENENPELRPPSGFNTTYKRNVWDEPCSTISTNFSMISGCRNVHPTDTRSLTIREAARIQSFPDEFVFCGNWGDIRKAIGNAVPPILARSIAEEIIRQILYEEE
ncbi:MAG: DNA (cytosine-5-)-methyltransferase [Anaerostipes sp.]|uniref:DNA (cytosine-5-)-methyltransferase n=1 Tax=Anaerostipes sp. TaxID=1872530 RepID=UPI00399245AE